MSYILDALRKSESERNQGRVPDLGQQVQLIHKPRSRGIPVMGWVGLGLILNAVVVALVFWQGWPETSQPASSASTAAAVTPAVEPVPVAPAAAPVAPATPVTSEPEPTESAVAASGEAEVPAPEVAPEKPTVIVPSWKSAGTATPVTEPEAGFGEGRVPHLVEMPMSFQRRIPTLIFSSHVYASDPSARRVMINDNYLRPGERFAGILVEQITVDGVVLSLDGQRFRVGVVRNWISPR
ncbi:MAG: general secretion pathway protein GspB [Marinobacter sp.]|uniref:general secretion pathway protein GspB n=1 Tax=Marinobacter sp. TaxID=50741 RepID=UPI00299F4010|nr:general secretion pathway protein GspB [Marinobacter sp.]MDX1633156.1 general secretion pathway protein GspB [Marinobacter sp.]